MNKKTKLALLIACMMMSTGIQAETTSRGGNEEPVMKQYTTVLKVGSKEALISGEVVTMPVEPIIQQGRTFLPLRFIGEQILQAEVMWDNQLKKATFKSGGQVVEVVLNQTEALVNGELVQMDVPPIMINNSILLPLRFMSEAFGMQVDYKSSDKSITITSMKENEGPIADFILSQEVYTEGQKIEVIDRSYDQDGDDLYHFIWTLEGIEYTSLEELEEALTKIKPGSYEITLTVGDYYDAWSETVSQTFTLNENRAPLITSFKPNKTSYAQGETIDFSYTYDNEEWEEITDVRWTYRNVNEPQYLSVVTKPEAFFAKSDYIVTLQLTDASGKVSSVEETVVHITDEVKETEFSYKFTKGEIGDTIDNTKGINYRNYQDVSAGNRLTNNETLVMSDSPEEVKENGILYTSNFNGKGRLLLHHINDFETAKAQEKMLVVVAENTYYNPVTITLTNKVVKGPAADILYLGQHLLNDYLKGVSKEVVTLYPGEKVYLYTSESKDWLKEQCISGLMDLHTTGDIQLTTAVIDKTDTIHTIDELEVLDKSIHVRGTFEGTKIYYDLTPQTDAASKLIVGQAEEEWVSGKDEVTGETVKNKGNFGVSYKIKITAQEDMGIFLNPRADVFRGAIKWEDGNPILMPKHGYFMNTSKKGIILGVMKKGETKTLEYMLPNGSSAPVLIGFVPKSSW